MRQDKDNESSSFNEELKLESQVPVHIRVLAASSGAFVTSFFTTPFDVIKIRLQAQTTGAPSLVWQDCTLRCCGLPPNSCVVHRRPATGGLRYSGSLDALGKTVRQEGVAALWRGLNYSLLMSVPATMVYFTAYDELSFRLRRLHERQAFPLPTALDPVFAGGLARLGTATLVGPLELIRTRIQSSSASLSNSSLVSHLRSIFVSDGLTGLWRGLGPTLWRDVPFSAFYWSAVERLKVPLHSFYASSERPTRLEGFKISFLAGAGAGFLASVLTNPFDVAKTRIQVEQPSSVPNRNTWHIVRDIVSSEGSGALMTGVVPRILRVVPACAIMIGSYEFCKIHFSQSYDL